MIYGLPCSLVFELAIADVDVLVWVGRVEEGRIVLVVEVAVIEIGTLDIKFRDLRAHISSPHARWS